MTQKKNIFFTLFFLLCAALIILRNLKLLQYNCLNALDFSIYQQGIINIADRVSLNPFLTVRGFNAFGDHFIPMMLTAVPFMWVTNNSPHTLIIIEFIFFLLPVLIFYLHTKKLNSEFFFLTFVLFFSKGLLSGLEFPIHPDYWSLPFWILIILFFEAKKSRELIITSFILCMFKESFSFAIFTFGFYLCLIKDFKTGLKIVLIGISWTIFNFILRPIYLGPVADYGGGVFAGAASSPLNYILQRFTQFNYLNWLKIYLPFFIPILWILKNKVKSLNHHLIATFFLTSPLFLLHFLTSKFYFHYNIVFIGPLIGCLMCAKFFNDFKQSKKIFITTCLLFFFTSTSHYTKYVKFLFNLKNTDKCSVTSEQQIATKQVINYLNKIDTSLKIFASGGIIPRAMRSSQLIYHIRGLYYPTFDFDILLLEKNNSGDSYPLTKMDVNDIIERCRPLVQDLIFDNDYFFLAKGHFTHSCLEK
jgi:hypothetical protein